MLLRVPVESFDEALMDNTLVNEEDEYDSDDSDDSQNVNWDPDLIFKNNAKLFYYREIEIIQILLPILMKTSKVQLSLHLARKSLEVHPL